MPRKRQRLASASASAGLSLILAAGLIAGPGFGGVAASAAPVLEPVGTVAAPPVVYDPIPYGAVRKKQMARFASRHYGVKDWRQLQVKQVILHFTVSNTYSSIHNWFASSTPAGYFPGKAEKPGVCAQFVIDKDGTIYQQVKLTKMCRHTTGLNSTSIGIEFVEMTSAANILGRPRQLQSGLALVRWLQAKYSISDKDVIGHQMANKSRYFQDNQGWINDHVDWYPSQVRTFRSQL